MREHGLRYRTAVAAVAATLLAGSACSAGGSSGGPRTSDEPRVSRAGVAGDSWAPRPRTEKGLTTLAQAVGDQFVLHTADGDVRFLPGIDLGSTTPGHQPGELAITSERYEAWFDQMGRLGIRSVRIYTIHPPAFYTALHRYNTAHPNAPLYLVQGVYLPDEPALLRGDFAGPESTRAFTRELTDAVAATVGDLRRTRRPGFAHGVWTHDVSAWVAGWIVGVELDGESVTRTNSVRQVPAGGWYVQSTPEANTTERWLAARLDELAATLAARGLSAPLAFVNWPTTDPLAHPAEPLAGEDLVGIDPNHVRASTRWPGGVFASYHVYPNFPDFLWHEPGLSRTRYAGRADPYVGYLNRLRRHHADMPVMVTEFGVPSSIGRAREGPVGRDQGGLSERQAMQIDARMLRSIHDLGFAGAFLFSWTDQWFKMTWNTEPRQRPAHRRQLWHDALSNEQFYGLLATDPARGVSARPKVVYRQNLARLFADAAAGRRQQVREVAASVDESWVRVRVRLSEPVSRPLALGFDVVDGGAGRLPGGAPDRRSDYAVVVDPRGKGQAWVRGPLDPVRLDDDMPRPPDDRQPDGWQHLRLSQHARQTIPSTGEVVPARFQEVGRLRRGHMDPGHVGYDSRATWNAVGRQVDLRLPWAALGVADPSSKRALLVGRDGSARTVPVRRIGLVVEDGGGLVRTRGITWTPWNVVRYTERLKPGVADLAEAFRAVSRP